VVVPTGTVVADLPTLRASSPAPRPPPLAIGPALDLPRRADAVDLLRIGELALLSHLSDPLVTHAKVVGDLEHPKGATMAHAASLEPVPSPGAGGKSGGKPAAFRFGN